MAVFDIKIVGGHVLDGSGESARLVDVGIADDRIAAIGDLEHAESKKVVDASGCLVCPGFVDAHSHSDAYLLIEPSSPSKLYQGITTEVVGNCGASASPLCGDYQMPSDWREKPFPGSWETFSEFRVLLETCEPGPNVVLLVGHNTLRGGVVGYENRAPSRDELAQMCGTLEECLAEGARGLSTGLIYAPGMFSQRDELLTLAGVLARHDGIYTSHMRSEGAGLLNAIEETVSIGRDTGARVQVSHLKASGRANWRFAGDAMQAIRDAREEGVRVAADRYPYTSACTDLDVIFPDWAAEGGSRAVLERLRTPGDRGRLREDLLESRSEEYWGTVRIGSTSHPDNARFRGMPLPDVADALGMHPVDAVLQLVDLDEVKTGAFFFGMSDDNMDRILREPYVAIGSDASLRATRGPLSKDYPHPRAYGSHARFLRMALDGKTVPIPEAVRKMTSLPAEHFGLKGRGRIAEGSFADVAVVDPGSIRDLSSYSDPHQYAEGVRTVIVNGTIELQDGAITGQRAGQVL